MSETPSNVDVNGQHAELLPARTVLSTVARAAEAGDDEGFGGLDSIIKVPTLDDAEPAPNDGITGAAGTATKGI